MGMALDLEVERLGEQRLEHDRILGIVSQQRLESAFDALLVKLPKSHRIISIDVHGLPRWDILEALLDALEPALEAEPLEPEAQVEMRLAKLDIKFAL